MDIESKNLIIIIGEKHMGLKETKVYSINDFINWHENNELILSAKYQRNSVWNEKAQSYLIDTILRGLPIPQVFVRQKIDTQLRKTTREIIDGQQRLRAIIKFYNNDLPIMKLHNEELSGKYYSDLDEEYKLTFLDYQIPVELIKSSDDNVIYDMFMRVNTNSITLNRQELRNAKYWGDLKVFAYRISGNYRNFFDEHNIFKPAQFIRMLDVEYISRLLRVIIEGIKTDTPKALDDFYNRYESYNQIEEVEKEFNDVFDTIQEIFNKEGIYSGHFSKPNYLFTLFCLIYHDKYGIEDYNFSLSKKLNYNTLGTKLNNLESYLSKDNLSEVEEKFINLHKSRTTNEPERLERIEMFIRYIDRGILS